MLDPSSEAMRKEIESFSGRLRALKQDFQDRGKLSEKNQALLDRVQQRKDQLEAKFSDAERTSAWNFIREEFDRDWNSLVMDVAILENRLCE